ncbi:hypothetical protein [Streptomyces davaonensis]|uniref:hypothetical protein n=1 Tax=Streptomyces davaonensis TaxID=348043 RepID=UPI00034829D7|nr:hypothetical protein [Streptomyces davaonensis]
MFSHTKIHDALTKALLPTRGVVELVVRELAKMARPPIDDIEAEVNRFAALWHAAHGDAPEAAPDHASDRAEGPMGDLGAARSTKRESEGEIQMRAATAHVYQTLVELKRLRPDPNHEWDLYLRTAGEERLAAVEAELGPRDEEGSKIWQDEWERLIQQLEVQTLDIDDTALRERIKDAREFMEWHTETFRVLRWPERKTRLIAARYAMESIEAFRGGDPLPEPSKEYVEMRGVSDLMDELDAERR